MKRPVGFGIFEFSVLSGLRAAQLSRGCTPRVDSGIHKLAIVAQMEVAEGKVLRVVPDLAVVLAAVAEAEAELAPV